MEKDFEIEIQDENVEGVGSAQLPMNFLAFGEIENDDVKVYIKQDVYKALEKLAASDTSKELGSIILGEYCQEHGKTHVVISQYIEAKYTDASAATLTFTHETWDYVHGEHAKRYPDKKIIGWQHTHPNYGIFLSNYDMFIQENFFNLPFQVAYVIDPIQNLRGFFQWKNGKIEKLKGYYIYDDVGKPIKIEQTKVKKDTAPGKTPFVTKLFIGILCAATVFLGGYSILMRQKYDQQVQKQDVLLAEKAEQDEMIAGQAAELDKQNLVIQDQTTAITKLEELLSDNAPDSTGQTTAQDLITMLENGEIVLPNGKQLISALKGYLENNATDGNAVVFHTYTVAEGDNLTWICQANGLDYGATAQVILALNGIQNPDHIYPGQVLLLPAVK